VNIAIIGHGNIGGNLAVAWAKKGHTVTFGARDTGEAKLREAVARAGGSTSAASVNDALAGAEVVALAVPFGAVQAVIEAAGSRLDGKTLIDCTNPIGATLPAGVTSGAEMIAKLAPRAHVVKSFNAQGAEIIASPMVGGERAANFYCGDDPAAKKIAHALIADVGFDPVDVGPLKLAHDVEAMTMVWITLSRSLGRHIAFRLLRD
jgi:predicted dinucleotide-binding enzyme